MFIYPQRHASANYDHLAVKDSQLVIAAQLARLLATENLSCRFSPTAKTASIDLKTREATFPLWYGITKALRYMLICHEVGHARDTPYKAWVAAIDKIANHHHTDPVIINRAKSMVVQFLNIIEDPRVDKRMKRRFPGCRHDYAVGLQELAARNFFGVDGTDVNKMTFIDRANLHFKSIPGQYSLKFTAAEQKLIDRIAATESFDDVVALTDEIYGLSKSQRKIVTAPGGEIEIREGGEEGEAGEAGEAGEGIEVEVCQGDGQKGDDDDKDQKGDDEGQGQEAGGDQGDDEGGDDDAEGNKGAGASDGDIIPECKTGEALQKALEDLAGRDAGAVYNYFDLPQVIHKNVVDDFNIVIPAMTDSVHYYSYHDKDKMIEAYRVWRRAENQTISFLVKEFQTRMAADIQSRTQTGKTGVIDTNKLYGYKYNDDVFRRNTTIAAGKNHGFVMFLDWSGSMIDNLNETMKQLFSLTMFCKRVGVPFEVFLVRSVAHNDVIEEQYVESKNECHIHYYGNFKLRNVLSSRMTTHQLNSAYEILWIASRGVAISSDPLNGTPLNQAILAADKIVNDFRRKNDLQIVNTIIMTDGIAEGASYRAPYLPNKSKVIVRDPITKMMYTRETGSSDTKVLLEVLRARTDTNLVGFFLSNSLNNISAYVLGYTERKDRSLRNKWNNDRYVALTNAGYDEYYLINIGNRNTFNDKLTIENGMSRHKITKAYMNTRATKGISRALLTRFIELIAKNKK